MATAIALLVVFAASAARRGPIGSTTAPSAAATAVPATPSASIAPSPSASAAPWPTPTPTAAAGARYVNAAMGYAIDLLPPWHRAACGSSTSGPLEGSDGVELFIAVPDRDFRFTDIGPNADHISVSAHANPKGLTYRQWKSAEIGGSVGETIEDVTFAGRPALFVTHGDDETFLVADAGYVYAVGHQSRRSGTSKADRAAIVRSFRFLTTDEIRAGRAAAKPSPAPRSVEAVADVLAEGFAKRDVSILARVIAPRCVSQGVYQDGVSSSDAQTYLDTLRDRFARGLTVEVRPRPITTSDEFKGASFVRSTWREPGQPDGDIDLEITVERNTAYWNGTIAYFRRPP